MALKYDQDVGLMLKSVWQIQIRFKSYILFYYQKNNRYVFDLQMNILLLENNQDGRWSEGLGSEGLGSEGLGSEGLDARNQRNSIVAKNVYFKPGNKNILVKINN